MSNPKSKKLTLASIHIDGGTQARAAIDTATVAEYAEAIESGIELPPIHVFFDGSTYWLADGFHRYHANAQRKQRSSIDAVIHNGTVRDALLYAAGANDAHGLRRTNKDKRRAVEILLADAVICTWSNERIAEAAKVGHSLVANVRQQLSESESSVQPETRIGKDGKARKQRHQRNQDEDPLDTGGGAASNCEPLAETESDSAGVPSDRVAWVVQEVQTLWNDYVGTFGDRAERFAFVAGLENWQARSET